MKPLSAREIFKKYEETKPAPTSVRIFDPKTGQEIIKEVSADIFAPVVLERGKFTPNVAWELREGKGWINRSGIIHKQFVRLDIIMLRDDGTEIEREPGTYGFLREDLEKQLSLIREKYIKKYNQWKKRQEKLKNPTEKIYVRGPYKKKNK